MRHFYISALTLIFCFYSVNAQLGTDTFTIASDDASTTNYPGGTWNNTTNGGSGFNTWAISSSGGGSYIGGTGQGSPSFGLFSDGAGNFAFAERAFSRALQSGDTFSVDLGHTATINGEIFLQFLDGTSPVLTLKFVGGDDRWRINDGGSDFDSGQLYSANTSISFTFTYEGGNVYSYTFGAGSGSNFVASNIISNITSVKFQTTNQGAGQNFGFNNLQITSKYTIPNGQTSSVTANTTAPYLEVQSGGSLVVDAGQGLTVTGNFTNNGTVTLNSTSTQYSSLIVNGSSSGGGTTIYNRHVNDNGPVNGNDLISAPVSGQAFNTFIGNNTNILANPGGTDVLFGGFDNNDAVNPFELWDETDTTPLAAGVGYRAGVDPVAASNLVSFEGTVNTGLVQVPIAQGSASILNLIGNPFSSYLDAQAFLTENASLLDPSAQVIYGYNDSTNGTSAGDYTIISTLVNNTLDIAPGQGFFVASNTDVGNMVQFTTNSPDMRITSTQDDFIAGRNASSVTNLKLDLSNASDNFITDVFFTEFSSLGLDPGYDATLLGGVAPPFSMFTHLVQENTGLPFAIQALGQTDYDNVSIALGVNANQGEQLTFSIAENTLPATIEVYLDDTLTSTSTLLNTSDYALTPAEALNGTGRFFLRFSNSTLSTSENNLEHIDIYTNQTNRSITIAGQLPEATIANVYDIQGRLVNSKVLSAETSLHVIDANSLYTGIYIVNLVGSNTTRTEKIILK
ncbi:MAG: T9SS type A sorting domain-containing protein [Winogradskyella sp.]